MPDGTMLYFCDMEVRNFSPYLLAVTVLRRACEGLPVMAYSVGGGQAEFPTTLRLWPTPGADIVAAEGELQLKVEVLGEHSPVAIDRRWFEEGESGWLKVLAEVRLKKEAK